MAAGLSIALRYVNGLTQQADGTYEVSGCVEPPNAEAELTGTHRPPTPDTDGLGSVELLYEGERWLAGTYTADDMRIEYREDRP